MILQQCRTRQDNERLNANVIFRAVMNSRRHHIIASELDLKNRRQARVRLLAFIDATFAADLNISAKCTSASPSFPHVPGSASSFFSFSHSLTLCNVAVEPPQVVLDVLTPSSVRSPWTSLRLSR